MECFGKPYAIACVKPWLSPKAYVMKSGGFLEWAIVGLETGPGILLGSGSRNGEGMDKLVTLWWKESENSRVLRGRDLKTIQHDQNSN